MMDLLIALIFTLNRGHLIRLVPLGDLQHRLKSFRGARSVLALPFTLRSEMRESKHKLPRLS
jgi:hypothetical protein